MKDEDFIQSLKEAGIYDLYDERTGRLKIPLRLFVPIWKSIDLEEHRRWREGFKLTLFQTRHVTW